MRSMSALPGGGRWTMMWMVFLGGIASNLSEMKSSDSSNFSGCIFFVSSLVKLFNEIVLAGEEGMATRQIVSLYASTSLKSAGFLALMRSLRSPIVSVNGTSTGKEVDSPSMRQKSLSWIIENRIRRRCRWRNPWIRGWTEKFLKQC